MEGHRQRSTREPGQVRPEIFAARTIDGDTEWVKPVVKGSLRLPLPHGGTAFSTGARVLVVSLTIAGLVFGVAGRSYSQAAGMPDGPEPGVLASEPAEKPIKPVLGSEPLDEEPEPVLESEPAEEPEPDEPVDELLEELERDEPRPAVEGGESVVEPEPQSDIKPDVTPGVVHLTFDDGPHPVHTPAILDVLARYDAKATFFVLGSLVEAHPDLVERIVAEGHTLANHSWNHEDLAPLTRAEFNDSVGRTQAGLGANATPCLRPPFGSLGSNIRDWAAELGLQVVLWTDDTLDWQKPGVDAIADRIVGAHSGSVVLLHDGGGDRSQTIEALDQALGELSASGFSFEPIC